MPDLSRGASELDTRLAEIDRKLRAIQVDLDPGREPAPSREPSDTPEAPAAQGEREPPRPKESARGRSGPLAALLQRSSRHSPRRPETVAPGETATPGPVSASEQSVPPDPPSRAEAGMVPPEMHGKLLSAMRDLLDAYGWTLKQLPLAEDLQAAGEPQPVALSVGPFVDIAAVHAFEHELLRIPGVSDVVLRGYEGENRAMFDVQLSEPNA